MNASNAAGTAAGTAGASPQDGADVGVIGPAVMGRNLMLNMADHGYHVIACNRTVEKMTGFVDGLPEGTSISGAETVEALVEGLSRPRKIMLMVQAGGAVDAVIAQLVPLLDAGDVIIDGGNSKFTDSQRRADALAEGGLLYAGTGVSGGEEGARHGPSPMPGGHIAAWPLIREMFQAIAAKTAAGEPCCDWFANRVHAAQDGWRRTLAAGVTHGQPGVQHRLRRLIRDA